MARINKAAQNNPVTITASKDGVKAFKNTKAHELCERVLTSFWGEDKFYENGKSSNNEIVKLIREVASEDPVFVAKLAILAREKYNLRTIPQVIAAELSRIHNGDGLVSALVPRVVNRPDEMSDIVAYVIDNFTKASTNIHGKTRHKNKKIPAQIRKGLDKAFRKFNEYQLSKYSCSGRSVKLRDILNLVRPRPESEEQAALWKRVLENTLTTADTWETNLSAVGQEAKNEDGSTDTEKLENLKKDAWETRILEKRLPYMAALRNLRNIMQAGVSKAAHESLRAYISNEKAVANSKQLPFRFFSAYRALEKESGIDMFEKKEYMKALNRALYFSGRNIPRLKGRTVIATDLSMSMNSHLSKMSDVTAKEVGAVLSALATQFCEEVLTIGFADNAKVINLTDDPNHTLEDVNTILRTNIGCGTNAADVMHTLIKNKLKVDNIIFFTDGQFNSGTFSSTDTRYRSEINPDVYIYSVNLMGYGSTQHDPRNPRNVFMAGWSDNLLKYIAQYQEFRNGIVDMVNEVDFKF